MPEAMPAGGEEMPVDETATKDDNLLAEEQPPAELILTLKNKKQIPFPNWQKQKEEEKERLKKYNRRYAVCGFGL